MKSRVVLVPCDTYDEECVYSAVKQGLELLGGLEKYVSADDRILVKANLLSSAAPEKAVTTHPSVFSAVLRCLRESGCGNVKYGDAPGSPVENISVTAKTCGLTEVAEAWNVEFGDFMNARKVEYPEGRVLCCAMRCSRRILS